VFLELKEVSFKYPKREKMIISGLNLSFAGTGITAIVGPNGSGKTTLTKLMMGILKATAGLVCLEGRAIAEYSLAAVGRKIGYVFQNPELQLFCPTVSEEISFGLLNQGADQETVREKTDFYLKYFELDNYRQAFPLHLSQGEKQRLAIAAVLAGEPEFLIMDEPTVGLDAYRKHLLRVNLEKVAALGRGIILVSHDAIFVQRIAKRLVVIDQGRVEADNG